MGKRRGPDIGGEWAMVAGFFGGRRGCHNLVILQAGQLQQDTSSLHSPEESTMEHGGNKLAQGC